MDRNICFIEVIKFRDHEISVDIPKNSTLAFLVVVPDWLLAYISFGE